ncbi:sulfotransferase domain-containing protein [Bauldia litoralis]|uniref:Sulfotransferase domain-containing protein n=1 Tax=Bauldia litoralis TaxID=665467 RepID=A0A1G6D9Z4_9HYPH|nr:sulfotransferase domain-containing protein [Bauldia litoralis]SDB41705.1 Sulfotransferase domain-containing protein [Bauldia litoralis]
MINVSKDNPRGIVWIASYPRSGNTWTRAFINGLTRIMEDPDAEDIDLGSVSQWSVSERLLTRYTPFLGKPATAATPAEIAAVRPRVQASIAAAAPGIVFVKTHNANGKDFGVPLINKAASAGAIYIVRNPLDVAISYAAFSNASIDEAIKTMATEGWGIQSTAESARVISGSWSQNVASWTDHPNPAVLAVRYEDMLDRPDSTFARIARHIRLKPNNSQIRRAVAMTDFDRLRAGEEKSGFAEKPNTADTFFRAGRAGQWQETLSPEQVATIVADHGRMMARFDYLPPEYRTASAGGAKRLDSAAKRRHGRSR